MLRVLEVSGTVIPQDILDTVAYSHLLEEWTWDAFDLKLLQPMTFSLPGLPSLRRLSLHGEFNFSLLDTFRAAQLVALELTYRPRKALISRAGFPALLSLPLNSVSFPSLQILSIDGYPGIIEKNELSIARFFCNHPTLQFLSLSEGINKGLLDAISALPSLMHFNIINHSHSEPQSQFWPLIRRWHTKARENRQWTSPTLYFPALCWYSGTVKISAEFEGDLEFCQFARQVVLPLSEPVFEQEMGESIGNRESLLEICGGIPLRDSWADQCP
ncbi:hypothetical protein DL93DRAFT_1763623 [Clavulina sp. PMI_390]|nr:hypothetical protein DL93DRAFT_1763623 [Clavulina sp. PMI_390]